VIIYAAVSIKPKISVNRITLKQEEINLPFGRSFFSQVSIMIWTWDSLLFFSSADKDLDHNQSTHTVTQTVVNQS
jgi:hypothetical protein